ncbi:MAG: diphthamide biosynthesis enzyme Dph2 [Candidatus Aenigmarchaeota archaeon]|nr:diphthamide biosynthesis enzyme Dph2 [Candidatus Aenigmarchaeota archaeon]
MFNVTQKKEIYDLIKNENAKNVFIQIPEGLKNSSNQLVSFLESKGIDILLSVEPCFGACDLKDREAKALGCDLLLHIGHKDFGVKPALPVIYYEYSIDFDFVPLVKITLKQLKSKKICLITTIQFVKSLRDVKTFLEKNGIKTYIGGEVLGCEATNAKKYENMVDEFLFIGSGNFHPLGIQEKVSKPVMFLNVEKRTLENLSKEKTKLDVKRAMRIQKAKELNNFAILVSTKPGQFHLKTAKNVKKKLTKMGKNAFIIVCDQVTPEKLLGLKIDVIVNTACPRITEDSSQFKKIILVPEDVDNL